MANSIQSPLFFQGLDPVEGDGSLRLSICERHVSIAGLRYLSEDVRKVDDSWKGHTLESRNGNPVTLPSDNHITSTSLSDYNRNFQKDAKAAVIHSLRDTSIQADLRQAVQQVSHLAHEGVYVPDCSLIQLIQRCIDENDLVSGRETHRIVKLCGLSSDAFIGSHIIRMFGTFGCLAEAMEAFTSISYPSTFAWNAIISAHVNLGYFEQAIQMYSKLQDADVEPDGYLFVTVLKACIGLRNFEQSCRIHLDIVKSGFDAEVFIGSTLVDMYAKCGSTEIASQIFYRMNSRNVVSWTVLIDAYSEHGDGEKALELLEQMRSEGLEPNIVTFASVLKACSLLEAGRQVHSYIIDYGFELNDYVSCMLVNMYVRSATFVDVPIIFDKFRQGGILTRNALIGGLCTCGCDKDALNIFQQMQQEGVQSSLCSYSYILKACTNLGAFQEGLLVHCLMIENIEQQDVYTGSSLIDFYSKSGDLRSAEAVFHRLPEHNVVTWSALITGFLQHGHSEQVLTFFQQMKKEGVVPDDYTLVSILKACTDLSLFEQGRQIHATLIEGGFDTETIVSNALMDTYIRWNCFQDACKIFNKLQSRDVVSWTTLMAGITEHEDGQVALHHYAAMLHEGLKPNMTTFLVILKACSSVAALEHGRHLHAQLVQCGFVLDVYISSALIDMYSKCGCLEGAQMVFHRCSKYDAGVWSAMITGYAQHSNYQRAFSYFESMQMSGSKLDSITFLCILSACNRAGLVHEGRQHLKLMRDTYGLQPGQEHLNCMVDILGNSNLQDEARDLLETIPFGPNIAGWMSLLSSCKKHLNVDIGKQCFENIVSLDRTNVLSYVFMSDIYFASGMEMHGEKIKSLRLVSNGWKKPGKAFIEVDQEIHSFFVGDKSHPESEAIYEKLKKLKLQIEMEGATLIQSSISEKGNARSREDELCGHCEKLALSFGLLHTPQGATIRIAKNLRMCAVCHSDIQFISKAERRNIVIVDTCVVHHFQNGLCQCQTYDV